MTKRILKYTVLSAAAITTIAACSGKNKADVLATAAKATQDKNACPAQIINTAGTYSFKAKDVKGTFFVKLTSDKDKNLKIEVPGIIDASSDTALPVDGNKKMMKNGSQLQASCSSATAGTINVIGTNKAKGVVNTRITLVDKNDYKKGLTVTSQGVKPVTYEWAPISGAIEAPVVGAGTSAENEVPFPRSEDLTAAQTNQQPPAPQAPAAAPAAPATPK